VTLLGTDPDGDVLSYRIVTQPAHGTISGFNATTGDLTYVPNPNYNGSDAFTYEVCDPSGACSQATVSLTVQPVNDPPVATSIVISGIAGADLAGKLHGFDLDGDALAFRLVSGPEHGRVESLSEDGRIVYVADSDYVGQVTILFDACDASGLCGRGTLQIFLFQAGGGGGLIEDARVLISEVAWAGEEAGSERQWIELRNLRSSPVSLEDWTLRWRPKMPTSSLDRVWQTLRLGGTMAEMQKDPQLQLVRPGASGEPYRLIWPADSTDDLYLIEWESDDTVADIPAELLVDRRALPESYLHAAGDVIQLLDPMGRVVDTANTLPDGVSGWAAGKLSNHATMERTPPYREDTPDNWHSNLGLLRFGTNQIGGPVFGTPRYPNSPLLQTLPQTETLPLTPLSPAEDVVILLPDSQDLALDPAKWLVVATRPDEPSLSTNLAVSVTRVGDQQTEIRLAGASLPTGRFDLWIRLPSEEVILESFVAQ
jgi:hypothetical protein